MKKTFKDAIHEMANEVRSTKEMIGGIARIVTDYQHNQRISQPKIQMQCLGGKSFSGKILYRNHGEETMNEVVIDVKFEAS